MILSIEFGSNIKIIEGCRKKNNVVITKAVTLNVAADIYHGDMNSIDLLADVIKSALSENKIHAKKAIFNVNCQSIIIRKFKLPLLKKESETLSMITYELKYLIPTDLDQYKIIYKIIDTYDEKSALYCVYCLPLNIYAQYMKLAKILKLKLIKLDIPSNCLNAICEQGLAINNSGLSKEGVFAFVGIYPQRVTFCAINRGVNDFFRICNINDSIEGIAAEHSIFYMNSDSYHSDAFENISLLWLEEINKSIRFYYSVDNRRISKIYIFGHFSSQWNFDKLLSLNTNIDIEIVKSLSNIDFKEKMPINEYFIPVMALYNLKSMNFLYKVRDNSALFKRITLTSAVLLCFFFLVHSRNSLQKEVEAMGSYVNDTENVRHSSSIERLREENILLENKINLIEDVIYSINNEYVNSEMLRTIYYSVPKNTRVLSFSANKSSINMECVSSSIDDVILLLSYLNDMDFIDGINTPEIRSFQDSRYSYSIVCKFKDVSYIEIEKNEE